MPAITALAPGYFVDSEGFVPQDVYYINPITGEFSEPGVKMFVGYEEFKNSFGDVVPFKRRVEGISVSDAKKALSKAMNMFPEVRAISLIGSAPVSGPELVPALGYSTSNLYILLGSQPGDRVAIAPASILLGNVLTREAIIDMINRIKPGMWGNIIDAPL